MEMNSKQNLTSQCKGIMNSLPSLLYKNIIKSKKPCCLDWQNQPDLFYEWCRKQLKKQRCLCYYCHLPGDTNVYYGHYFRPPSYKGTRGRHLEVDRKRSKEPYSPQNCVLACYPCNNAKSDVFSYDEFRRIGKAIRKVKKDNL